MGMEDVFVVTRADDVRDVRLVLSHQEFQDLIGALGNAEADQVRYNQPDALRRLQELEVKIGNAWMAAGEREL